MVNFEISRRDFLRQAAPLASLPILLNCSSTMQAQRSSSDTLSRLRANAVQDSRDEWWGARNVPDDVSWRSVISDESGNDVIATLISGTIYRADGKTPAPNVLIYLYHTDVHGKYGQGSEHRHGRYRGWMLTDADGRYEFRSIRPASYPDSTISAHIHMTLTTLGSKEDWVDSILFEGDRFITPSERVVRRGGFDPIVTLVKGKDGISRAVRNIQLAG